MSARLHPAPRTLGAGRTFRRNVSPEFFQQVLEEGPDLEEGEPTLRYCVGSCNRC